MKEYYIKKEKTVVREFSSLSDFNAYITTTPINDTFKWAPLDSVENSKKFTGTSSYEEALGLFNNGWSTKSSELSKKIDVIKGEIDNTQIDKIMYDVVGFQCSVPRYLQGIPTNMVNRKKVPQKQKVITINKDISYSSRIAKETIEGVSIQCLQLVKKIEAQGVRVNLNLVLGASSEGHHELAKIRLKSAGERLNISKLAFPLVHTSMLRRIFLRYIEVAPTVTSGYKQGYGTPFDPKKIAICTKGEYLLPRLFSGDITELGSSLNEIAIFSKK